ncbi:hypothetical protein BGAL_0366g00060 [Botrytis galanthina]|uniref:Uncharacterized protein n=1 Tax=Botrytis galanthina TaxID=278940 RepID=A0A4S8QYE1_9HELO|nr:hypothetical protein BGAL_0366g00060 [Botrytis galanthina]
MFLTRGAGGFSIGPLRRPFYKALGGKSWVYSKFDALRMYPEFDSSGGWHWGSNSRVNKYNERGKAMEQLEELVNHTLNELRILFQNGKASPNDLDEAGVPLSEVRIQKTFYIGSNV